MSHQAVIVGGGIFGLSAALELRARGWSVSLVNARKIPDDRSASDDISKVWRFEYGADEAYIDLMDEALRGWRRWSELATEEGLEPFFHDTGILVMARQQPTPTDFESQCITKLKARGHQLKALSPDLAEHFPSWAPGVFRHGFYNPRGGYVESGRVIEWLAGQARQRGVKVIEDCEVSGWLTEEGRVCGVKASGAEFRGDAVVLAAGAWAGSVLGRQNPSLRATAHPVFHLKPKRPELFVPERFPVFFADIPRTGVYGFPLHRRGVVKVAIHGAGIEGDPSAPRVMPEAARTRLRSFLNEALPALADAPIVYERLCFYCDSPDEDFLIDAHPELPGLVVASAGSGHGFKFGPAFGRLIAEVVEGQAAHPKFAWRQREHSGPRGDAARCKT